MSIKNLFKINKNQTVKLGKGFIELKKYSRQIPNLFKIMLIVSVFLPVLKELKKKWFLHTKKSRSQSLQCFL